MEYFFLLAAVAAGIHACSFAWWLGQNDNKTGTLLVIFLVAASIAVPVWRILTAP